MALLTLTLALPIARVPLIRLRQLRLCENTRRGRPLLRHVYNSFRKSLHTTPYYIHVYHKVGGAAVIDEQQDNKGGGCDPSSVMRPMRCYLCAISNLVVFTVWVLLWEQYRLSTLDDPQSCACSCDQTQGAQVETNMNGTGLISPAATSRRPLLVRFDWYSRKQTPIHIGCVGYLLEANYCTLTLYYATDLLSGMLAGQQWLYWSRMDLKKLILMTGYVSSIFCTDGSII